MRLRSLICLGLTACFGLAAAPVASAEEEMAWTVSRFQSDSPNMPETVMLHYGIPQTDAVAFEASCGGPQNAGPVAILWYDVVDMDEGDEVELSVSAGVYKGDMLGRVFGTDAEVGISGIEIAIDADAALWDAMMDGQTLVYGIEGGPEEILRLQGAAPAIAEFTSACQAMPSKARPEPSNGA